MFSDLQYLTVSLPEDIEKLKWYGDFERAKKLIDLRLQKEIPKALRKRLELEKWVLERMPLDYVYTKEEALALMEGALENVTEEELERFRDEGAAEWIFVNGQVRYKDNFLENLLKTRKELWPRLKDASMVEGRIRGGELLDKTIASMKEKGGLAYRMRIRATLEIEKSAQRPGKLLRVHLPIPVEQGQVKNFRLLGTSMEPVCIAPPDYPQRTVYMETRLKPRDVFWVEYEFENHTRYCRLEEEKAVQAAIDGELRECLEELPPHICFTPYLRELTRQIVGGEENPLRKARKIYDYLTVHVMYSFVRPYATIANLPEYMALGLKGDCGIYALLFITMCRIAGVPAKWQSGLYGTPLEIGNHDWARFYVAPYGWLYADCSFGGSAWRDGKKERWDFYFGNLDPFRVPLCSRFQHEFTPPGKFLREDPYDNQSGETEYEDGGLINELDYKTKKEILSIEEITLAPR